MRGPFVIALSLPLACVACTLLNPLGEYGTNPLGDDASMDAGATDSGAESSVSADAEAGCARPRPMVTARTPRGAFQIDATEVTQADYACFLREGALAIASSLPPACAYRTSHAPSSAGACGAVFSPDTLPSRPVRCVDWCDAWAFCAWQGRRLCGRLGGGVLTSADVDGPSDEWHVACSRDGAVKYPYGASANATACWIDPQSAGASPTAPIDVGTMPTCEGGYPGLFDMSGNIREWIASCDGELGRDDVCYARGGGFTTFVPNATCGVVRRSEARFRRDGRVEAPTAEDALDGLGIRCCADAK